MSTTHKRTHDLLIISALVIGTFILQLLLSRLVHTSIFASLSDNQFTCVAVVLQAALYLFPAAFYVRGVKGKTIWTGLGLHRTATSGVRTIALFSAVLIACQWLVDVVYGGVHVELDLFFYDWFGIILASPMMEEIFFRGFLLQALREHMRFSSANVLTTGVYLLMHIPTWMAGGLPWPVLTLIIATLALMSWMNGYLMKRTGSLWAGIFLHMINNLASTLIVPTA